MVDEYEEKYEAWCGSRFKDMYAKFNEGTLFDIDHPTPDEENYRINPNDEYKVVRSIKAISLATRFQRSTNEVPPVIEEVNLWVIPDEKKIDAKYMADQTLGRIDGEHFDKAKELHAVY